MIKIVEQSMLYDFYGELLNEHQKKIYEDVVFNDMSPSEIAREEGISRQGVHDLIKRCDKILKSYEDKLHLVEKFMNTKKDVNRIKLLSVDLKNTAIDGENAAVDEKNTDSLRFIDEIILIADKILSEI